MARSLWTEEELCSHVFPSTFIISPIFPRGGIALCYGKRGIGKSHFALTVAKCLVDGGNLFGRYKTRKGPVVYIQADMGPALMQDRVRLARLAYPSGLFYHFNEFLNLPEMSPQDELVKEINELQPELIIWDTLRQVHRMDANAGETVAWVYGNARHCFPGISHMFLHHEKKTIADQEKLESDEVFSGNSAWIDNVDLGLRLQALSEGGKLSLTFAKVRTAPPQRGLALSLATDSMLLYAISESAPALAAAWRLQNPQSSADQLRAYLLSAFVAPPRVVESLVLAHAPVESSSSREGGLDSRPSLRMPGRAFRPRPEPETFKEAV